MDEIIFTSGGTEANNTALWGLCDIYPQKRHILTTALEHSSVYEACSVLEKKGYTVTRLMPDGAGFISVDEFQRSLRKDTLLASVMLANNEVGTIQPVSEMARIAGERGVFFHTDAVQAVGKISVDVDSLSVDLLSLSGHKLYGPKGSGALYVRRGIPLSPVLCGGGQENRRRSGTENVPACAGLGKACEVAEETRESDDRRVRELKHFFIDRMTETIPQAVILGGVQPPTLANTVTIGFPGHDQETLAMALDLEGICAATGSACGSSRREASRVLKSMGISGPLLFSALRFSLHRGITKKDLLETVRVLAGIIL
jgi:cysteine desulfurase